MMFSFGSSRSEPPLMRSHASIAAPNLAELRRLTEHMAGPRDARDVLPFGIPEMDAALPGGGLAIGGVHEISEPGPRGPYAPVAALFAAGILSRLEGPVLWCLHSRDLFAPALARVGLHPDRVIYCETWKDAEILPSMEEGPPGHRGGGRRAQLPSAHAVPPPSACGGNLQSHRAGGAKVQRQRARAERGHFALAGVIDAIWRPGHRHGPGALACRTPALPWGGAKFLGGGGLRCAASSRSSCRRGHATACGGRTPARHRVTVRWSRSCRKATGALSRLRTKRREGSSFIPA